MEFSPRRWGLWSLLVTAAPVLTVWMVLFSGCRPTPVAPKTALPVVELDTPQAAARSLLLTLRAYLDARAGHDAPGAGQALEQAAERVAARDVLVARVTRERGRPPKDEARWLRDLVQNWAATIAYYRQLDFDRVTARPAGTARQQEVLVPAAGAADRAVLRLMCVQGEDGRWRVDGVGFAAPAATSSGPAAATPAVGPSTQSSGKP